ncbi:hypothetical protein Sjap_003304 [Stephania japonica]|uniref:Uncharacterized protein n=1 Tax=Stephania japonica TaxID=461633 RepID=A0AAP0KQ83_9MAGN
MSLLRSLSLAIITTLLLVRPSAPTDPDAERVEELLSLQSQSPSGVIRLTDETLARFLTSHPTRSYSLLIFFDAVQLHDKPELHLESLRSDFALVAHSFISNNNNNNNNNNNTLLLRHRIQALPVLLLPLLRELPPPHPPRLTPPPNPQAVAAHGPGPLLPPPGLPPGLRPGPHRPLRGPHRPPPGHLHKTTHFNFPTCPRFGTLFGEEGFGGRHIVARASVVDDSLRVCLLLQCFWSDA